jgi:intraflagellar transport protein 88
MAQQKYDEAIKSYEMGVNHLKPDMNRLIARFNQCCGIAQLALGDYHKALSSFETAMRQDPSIKSGHNLVLCHSILSSADELKGAFTRLLSVKPSLSLSELSESDVLGNQLHIERQEQIRLVMLASRLVASQNEKEWQQSFEFVFQQLKKSKFPEAASEFEVSYSLAYLNHRDAAKAIEMLRQIRKKDPQLMALAATNLSFLYFLEQDFENANKYADIALEHDKYNAQALVNKGNCLMQAGRDEDARDSYVEAIGIEADCFEALYNLGLVSKLMGSYDEALRIFQKLNQLVPKSPEVVFELSDCSERTGNIPQAIDWLHLLISVLPSDPAIWRRLGGIWDRDGNETQAFHCYSESLKYCPSDLEVITWLGTYFRRHQHFDNALKFYERASTLAPKEPRYPLMVASCYRNMDCKQEALEVYERAIQMDAMNRQCLEHLVKLTTEMGLSAKTDQYQLMLKDLTDRLEEMNEQEGYQRQTGAGGDGDGFNAKQTNAMSGTSVTSPLRLPAETVESPALRFGGTGTDLVQTAVAGTGKEDIWEGIDDLDLGS